MNPDVWPDDVVVCDAMLLEVPAGDFSLTEVALQRETQIFCCNCGSCWVVTWISWNWADLWSCSLAVIWLNSWDCWLDLWGGCWRDFTCWRLLARWRSSVCCIVVICLGQVQCFNFVMKNTGVSELINIRLLAYLG